MLFYIRRTANSLFLLWILFATGCGGKTERADGNLSPQVDSTSEKYQRAKEQQDAMMRENARKEQEATRGKSLDP